MGGGEGEVKEEEWDGIIEIAETRRRRMHFNDAPPQLFPRPESDVASQAFGAFILERYEVMQGWDGLFSPKKDLLKMTDCQLSKASGQENH